MLTVTVNVRSGFSFADFENFAFRYDILELNTAVKPYFLTYLRDTYDLDRIFYFDPDILAAFREIHQEFRRVHAEILPWP